ncbi:MAG: hypothetical protein LBV46_02925 [Bacteroidales bacterium]|jgi:hypothetical protein|nr:hypothetical protein [Bacteroidales bacterium]
MKEFIRKNLTWWHIAGLLFGAIMSFLYWYKKGQYSDYLLKNNLFLILICGMAMGYLVFDFIKSAKNKKGN